MNRSTLRIGAALAMGLAATPLLLHDAPEVLQASAPVGPASVATDVASHAAAVLDDGSFLFVDLTAAEEGDAVRLGGTVSLDVSENRGQSLLFAVDVSNSTLDEGEGCGGDFNGDGLTDTILDCELASVLTTVEALELAEVDEVGVVLFFAEGAAADVQPGDGLQTFTTPGADRDGDGIRDLETVLRSVAKHELYQAGAERFTRVLVRQTPLLVGPGQTWFSAGLEAACAGFGASALPNHTLVFLADGEPTHGAHPSAVLPCAVPTVVQAVAVGAAASCEAGSPEVGSLQAVADAGGGVCVRVAEPDDLSAALIDLVLPQITAVTLAVDEGPPLDLADALDAPLPAAGPVTIAVDHAVELADGEMLLVAPPVPVAGLS